MIVWETQTQGALELCSADYEIGKAYKDKTHKIRQVACQELRLKLARKRVLVKQELVGVQMAAAWLLTQGET